MESCVNNVAESPWRNSAPLLFMIAQNVQTTFYQQDILPYADSDVLIQQTHSSPQFMSSFKSWYAPRRSIVMIRSKGVTFIIAALIIIILLGTFITSESRFKNNISLRGTITKWKSLLDKSVSGINSLNGISSEDVTEQPTAHVRTEPKTIIFWTKLYGSPSWRVKTGMEECGPFTCYLTYNKSLYDNASALLFHHRTDWLERLPTDRPRIPWQRWVLYNRESSWWGPRGEQLNRANNLINWTMGFRQDNDITIPTAAVRKGQFEEGFDPDKNYLEGKTGDLAALMSACRFYPHPGYESRRKYLEFLIKHGLKVDMYGKCGKDCGGKFSSCSSMIKNYKFVLALENSLCDEYISEKPYRNGLLLGVVPVVMSGATLSDPYILPPGSFIDAGQFSSVSKLVAFLEKVGSDPQLYNKYFEWRKDWDFRLISENEGLENYSDDYFCPLCVRLHESRPPKSIGKLQDWFEQEKCWPFPTMEP